MHAVHQKAECAIISAERAGYTFEENAERTDALRVQLSDPFRGVRTLVFDCRLIDSKGVQPRDRLGRYLFIAEHPAFKGAPSDSPLLERLIKLSDKCNKGSFILIPHEDSEAACLALSVIKKSKSGGSRKLEQIGSVSFDADNEQVTISGPDKRLVFNVTGTAPIIQPSMITAYLFRGLKRRHYPGMPASESEPQTRPIRPRRARREGFSWSGECATKKARYDSGSSVKASLYGGRS